MSDIPVAENSSSDKQKAFGIASFALLGAGGLFYLASLNFKHGQNKALPQTGLKEIDTIGSCTRPESELQTTHEDNEEGYGSCKLNNVEKTKSPYPKVIQGNSKSSKIITKKIKWHLPKQMRNEGNLKKKIFKFVITGGPCAGKSSCLRFLSDRFHPKYEVFIVPETATSTIMSGFNINPARFSKSAHCDVILALMKYQMDMENYFLEIAKDEKKDVIIFVDRGMLDNFAYVVPEVKDMILKKTGWTVADINKCYDGVFHQVTAADGAEKYYTTANNDARTEGLEEARGLDKKVQNAWVENPEHHIIDNKSSTGFDDKLQKLYTKITTYLGIPGEVYFMKKFLVPNHFQETDLPENIPFDTFEEKLVYLEIPEEERFNKLMWIRQRTDAYGDMCYSQHVRYLTPRHEERREQGNSISMRQYNLMKERQQDMTKRSISKNVTIFLYDNTKYQVESYYRLGNKITIQRINCDDVKGNQKKIPSFITVGEDISENGTYHTSNVAKK